MNTHYINISLLADPEFSYAHLLGALFTKLHRALVQLQANHIGISFPHHSLHPRTLGTVLRLHGNEAALQQLMTPPWLQGMRDHVQLTSIALAPPTQLHYLVQRRQFKTSVERLRRRRMRYTGETAEQVAVAIPHHIEQRPQLPFVQLRSSSTSQPFCLFIEQSVKHQQVSEGFFNSYGLSQTRTVPSF